MNAIPSQLFVELEHQLNCLNMEIENPLQRSNQAVKVIVPIVDKLKQWCHQYSFASANEEITFFRTIKPQFSAQIIYYTTLYKIEYNKPAPTTNPLKYFTKQKKAVNKFFTKNADFCKYYFAGSDYLDHKYFMRGQLDLRLQIDNIYFQCDPSFTSSHDYKVAQILAYQQINNYIDYEIMRLNPDAKAAPERPLKWTGSKVGIVELIYALHIEGVINNGTSDLKDIMRYFSKIFEIDLTQYHRTFSEISSRKSDRTKFLRNLNDNLLRKMDEVNRYQ